jgi:septum site-determining protein MinC
MDNTVAFKGIPGGLRLVLHPDTAWGAVMDAVREGIDTRRSFLENGAVYFEITGRTLSRGQKKEILDVLQQDVDLTGVGFGVKESVRPTAKVKNRTVKGPVRGGQLVDCEGDLTVIGDVNPGGEVQATGNIIVLGNLRGLAHAGRDGAFESIVFALHMAPLQVRIAGYVARPGENGTGPALIYLDKKNVMTIEPIGIGGSQGGEGWVK